jgi:predicted nucleotidyltransferase
MRDASEMISDKLGVRDLRGQIERFCAKWGIIEFAFFGSVLRQDFGSSSDIDVLVRFDDRTQHGFLDVVEMEEELGELFGRKVDLLTRRGVELSSNPIRKQSILTQAEVVYAA